MKTKVLSVVIAVAVFGITATVAAAPPWKSFLPFKRVSSDSNRSQSIHLRDTNGPWLILAATFSGEGAEQQAQELAEELRKRYHLSAYMFSEEFDYTDSLDGLTIDRFGDRKKMRYANASRYEAIAVLVGDFASVDDVQLEKTLDKIKQARPDCLDLEKRGESAQRFAGLRHFYRRLNSDSEKKKRGPMGNAFVTRNPLLPDEYFNSSGVDDFVVRLNKGVKHSLLENKGNFTVRVASFHGDDTMDASEIAELNRTGKVSNKLEVAADQAHRLTTALRKNGVEAYEFHDRHESIVAIGSFERDGTPLPDGSLDINPAILRIMKQYGANRRNLPGGGVVGLQPRSMEGVPFDVQPMPMKVPRQSIGEVARGRSFFR